MVLGERRPRGEGKRGREGKREEWRGGVGLGERRAKLEGKRKEWREEGRGGEGKEER